MGRWSSFAVFPAGGSADHVDALTIASSWHEGEADRRVASDGADQIARTLVRSYRSRCAFRPVAGAFHARGRIGGGEIDALCATAYGAPFRYDRWVEA